MTAGSFFVPVCPGGEFLCRQARRRGVVFRGWFLGMFLYQPFRLFGVFRAPARGTFPTPEKYPTRPKSRRYAAVGLVSARLRAGENAAGDAPDPALSNRTLRNFDT